MFKDTEIKMSDKERLDSLEEAKNQLREIEEEEAEEEYQKKIRNKSQKISGN